MGLRQPMGPPPGPPQGPPPGPPQGQPAGNQQNQLMELVGGVNEGLTVLTQFAGSVAPEYGERMGMVLAEFQATMDELASGAPPQGQQGPMPMGPAGAGPGAIPVR